MEQQKNMATISKKLEKSKLLPEFNLAYYNMTMKGSGADNVVYNSSSRFQSAQLGLGIPLFFGSQKAKINASKINQNIADIKFLDEKNQLQNQYQVLLSKHQSNLETINYFESTALKNAKLISATASKQFLNGDINYLEFVMLTNQAISIESNYLDAIKTFNETIIKINFLTTK
jgi:cobalt-zinc-cadmium resistance protein CzcA